MFDTKRASHTLTNLFWNICRTDKHGKIYSPDEGSNICRTLFEMSLSLFFFLFDFDRNLEVLSNFNFKVYIIELHYNMYIGSQTVQCRRPGGGGRRQSAHWYKAAKPTDAHQCVKVRYKHMMWPSSAKCVTNVGIDISDCSKGRKVAGSIPDGVFGILHWHDPFGCTMALGLTQPRTGMRTRNISWE